MQYSAASSMILQMWALVQYSKAKTAVTQQMLRERELRGWYAPIFLYSNIMRWLLLHFDGNPKNKDSGNYKAKPVHLKSRTKQQWWRGGEEWWTPLPIWSAFSPVVHKLATVLSPNMDAKTTLLHHTANFGNQRGEWCDYHDGVAKKAMLSKENL